MRKSCFIFDPCLVVNDVLAQLCLNELAVMDSSEWATNVEFSIEVSVPLETVKIMEAVNVTTETVQISTLV